ncbi:endonuclease/exonuclease/phosphatase family protein, partial [Trifolium medium]|nr:endonuclease/exonuclease/phosphatase family protein [Trifolium medium]
METKLYEDEMKKIQFRCGFSSGLAISCRGQGRERAGGLAIWWSDNVNYKINSYSLNHIQGEITNQDEEDAWTLTGVYGFPDENRKNDTWELIKNLSLTAL